MQLMLPQFLPSLLAVLGLLLIWQVHHMQVASGRIQAANFWDRSGIRMFIHATPDDEQTCPACREANGIAMLPAVTAKKHFSPRHGPCTNPAGCRCQLIGLYGDWPEAQRLFWQVRNSSTKSIKATNEKLTALLGASWEQAPHGKTDRLSMQMLEATRAEGKDLTTALDKYQVVVEKAKAPRDLAFVIPAYLRMLDLLERAQRPTEALELIGHLGKYLSDHRTGPTPPSPRLLDLLSLRKTRLLKAEAQVMV